MPTEIGIFTEKATSFDRSYAEHILSTFNHHEYIKKKLLPGMRLVERDIETGIMRDI